MPKSQTEKRAARELPGEGGAQYRGKQTKTGNSQGFRLDGAFFKSHAEFNDQEVKVTVIAPGRALISVELQGAPTEKDDPLISSYLAFLAKEVVRNPRAIRPLSASLVRRMRVLTRGIAVDPEEDLGEEISL
jgi:prlF antitoxin for toxin YhaV_toxin